MPTLPVTCPVCDADLTVGREHVNRPVQCGACGKPFVPVIDPGGREADHQPAPRKREGIGPLFGILSLIMGLGGLVTCCCGPFSLLLGGGAVVSGLIGLRARDGRGLAVAGLVLGLVAVVLRVAGMAAGFGFSGGDPFDIF
jgi:hypothetical protein